MKQTINTVFGEADYSHTEQDEEFYHNDSIYTYRNGYAVLHNEDSHDIFVLRQEAGEKEVEKQ